jgi:AraC-like DNA-binding protein
MNHLIDIRQYFTPIQPNANVLTDNLVYQEVSPDIKLHKYIYCYWKFKTTEPLTEELNHIIVADGCIDIFFELQNPQDNFVMGFCEKFTEFSLSTSFNHVGVRFLPTMFSQIFKISAKEIANKFEHLANVVPSTSFFIREHIEPENNLDKIKSVFDKYFLQLIEESSFDWDSRMYESLKIILRNYGVVDIQNDLNTGISQRQLRRLFDFYIGDTPKTFSQVVRFQNILKAKPSSQSLKQNKLFFDLGYYDQSHFIKEFKKLHGVTPNKAFRM